MKWNGWFTGALLLKARHGLTDLMASLAPAPVLGRVLARAVPVTALAFLAMGAGILVSYAQITRSVWFS